MEPGSVIANRYEIIDTIGSGRTSVVYLAKDNQAGRTVAVKAIRYELLVTNPDATMRFMREGAVLKQLQNPNIVKVYDTFEEEDGSYIIMTYVDGPSLETRLTTEGPLPITEALTIVCHIAGALAQLHGLGIIHRDVTTKNIMLDSNSTPYLMDFGVAHMGHLSPMTIKGALLGEVSYLSPELMLEREKASVRSDIWSLGMVAYRILAGRFPFDIKKMEDSLILIRKPSPPITTYREGVPEEAVVLIGQMLAIDSSARIQTMQIVQDTLAGVLQL